MLSQECRLNRCLDLKWCAIMVQWCGVVWSVVWCGVVWSLVWYGVEGERIAK